MPVRLAPRPVFLAGREGLLAELDAQLLGRKGLSAELDDGLAGRDGPGPGRVLITTQNQHWSAGQALDVPVLDIEVAADFLVSRTGDPDRAAARELAVELGGLPLALEQAAAYMQATGTALAGYLPLFRARQADLLARGEAAGHPADVAATLGLALSRLAGEAPAAAVAIWTIGRQEDDQRHLARRD